MNTKFRIGSLRTFFFLSLGIFTLIGCAAGPKTSSGVSVENDVMGAFEKGEIRLTCGLSCAYLSGFRKSKIERQFKAGAWRNVIHEISEVGFESDLNYFLLARSAEELGFKEAAKTYYDLALSSSYRCPSGGSACSGFSFPEDILDRRDLLTKSDAEGEENSERSKPEVEVEVEVGSDPSVSALVKSSEIKASNQRLTVVDMTGKDVDTITEEIKKALAEKKRSETVIDVIGIYPGISTKSQVASKKSGRFFIIGGYQILCLPEFKRGKLSRLYCETGEDRYSKDRISGADRPVTNFEVHEQLLAGFSKKFGPPRLEEETVRTKLGVTYESQSAVWKDKFGNRLTAISIFNSVDRGLLLLESSDSIAASHDKVRRNDERRKF